jgi:hypothetical protein
LSATEKNSAALKARCLAETALSDTAWLGFWSRRPRVRVPSLTFFPLLVAMLPFRYSGQGLTRGPDRGTSAAGEKRGIEPNRWLVGRRDFRACGPRGRIPGRTGCCRTTLHRRAAIRLHARVARSGHSASPGGVSFAIEAGASFVGLRLSLLVRSERLRSDHGDARIHVCNRERDSAASPRALQTDRPSAARTGPAGRVATDRALPLRNGDEPWAGRRGLP